MRRSDRGRRAQEQTSQVWDALAHGASPAIATSDPTLLETVHRLKALGEQPRADPDFADRLEAELMRELSSALFTDVTLTRSPTRVPNGRSAPDPLWRLTPSRDASRLHGWWPASLVTAALVVLTLFGSLAAFTDLLPVKLLDEESVNVPALRGALETDLPPGVAIEATLLQGTFDAIPPDGVWIDVERTVLDPGAAWSLGENQNNGEGPRLYRVESGALTIETDGPIDVTRSGSQTSTPVEAGAEVILNVGDAGFTPSGITSRWRNTGATPTSVLHASITTSELGTFPRGVHREPLIEQWSKNPPVTPVVMTVRHLTLDTGASLSPEQVPGIQGLYVETESLEVLINGRQGTQGASLLLPAHASRTVGGRGHKNIPANWTLRNVSDDPVTLLIMTVTPANPLAALPVQ